MYVIFFVRGKNSIVMVIMVTLFPAQRLNSSTEAQELMWLLMWLLFSARND